MENTSLTQAQESAQLSAASTEALEVQTASAGTDSQPRTAAGEVVPAEPKHGDSVDQSADPSPAASEAPEINSYTYNRGGIPEQLKRAGTSEAEKLPKLQTESYEEAAAGVKPEFREILDHLSAGLIGFPALPDAVVEKTLTAGATLDAAREQVSGLLEHGDTISAGISDLITPATLAESRRSIYKFLAIPNIEAGLADNALIVDHAALHAALGGETEDPKPQTASAEGAEDHLSLGERVTTLEKTLEDLRAVLLHHGIRGPQ